jgi:hypothetical protein
MNKYTKTDFLKPHELLILLLQSKVFLSAGKKLKIKLRGLFGDFIYKTKFVDLGYNKLTYLS